MFVQVVVVVCLCFGMRAFLFLINLKAQTAPFSSQVASMEKEFVSKLLSTRNDLVFQQLGAFVLSSAQQ